MCKLHKFCNHLLIYLFNFRAVLNHHMGLEGWNAVNEKLVLISGIAFMAVPNYSYVLLDLYVRPYLNSECFYLSLVL